MNVGVDVRSGWLDVLGRRMGPRRCTRWVVHRGVVLAATWKAKEVRNRTENYPGR
jgi:hypothetical protein